MPWALIVAATVFAFSIVRCNNAETVYRTIEKAVPAEVNISKHKAVLGMDWGQECYSHAADFPPSARMDSFDEKSFGREGKAIGEAIADWRD